MADIVISVDIDARGTAKGSAEAKAAIKGIRDSIAGVDVKALSDKLKSVGSQMQQFGGQLRNVGTSLTLAVTAPLAAAGAAILKAGGEYEKALNIFQAVTKATGDEMARAADVAKDLGADLTLPATSAKDAALAMTELGKAGLSAADAMDAAKGVLQLAAAGQLDGARAAEIAANALNAFKLEAKETTRVADLLAAAANASSAGVDDIALAMQQASANFAAAKVPIEDLVTAISALANAGIKGSDAGTSLKTFIMSLQSPTTAAAETMRQLGIAVFDAAGKMKSLPEIIGQFEQSLAGLTDEQKVQALNKIFGSDAIRAAQILFSTGTEGFDKLKAAVTASGAAAELANAQMKGLSGAWAGFKSQLETIGIQIYEVVKAPLTQFMQAAAQYVGQAAQTFGQLSPAVQQAIIGLAAFAAAIGPLLVVVGSLVSAIGTIVSAAGAVAGLFASGGALASIGPFLIPIIIAIVAAIGQAVAIAYALYSAWTENFGGIQELTAIVADAIKYAWDALMTALRDLTVEILAEIRKFWQENGDEILQIIQVFSDGFRQLWTAIVNFWIENGDTIKQVTKAVWNAIKALIVETVRIIGKLIEVGLAVINGDWQKAWDATKEILTSVIKIWVSLLEASGTALVGALKIALQAIWNLQTWLYEQSYELGKMVVAGLIAGLKSMANPLGFAAKWVGDQVVNALKARLETQSPSKVTYEIGTWVAQGLADGIDAGTPEAVAAATSISGKVISGLQDVFGKDLGGFVENALGILTDGSKSWGDRLRSIFSGIAQNFRQMVGDMLKTWINSKIFGGGSGQGPGGTPNFNPGASGGGVPPTGTITIGPDGEPMYTVNGNQSAPFSLFGGGLTNGIGTIASLGMMAGGAIGGKFGGLISSVSGGALTGLMLGAKLGMVGGPVGAAIGAAAGFAMSILGGLFSSPKRKRDKNEKMPLLTQGFADALKQLRMLRDDKNAILSNPSGAMAKADELRAAIASGFGIQFESKKYSKIAQQQIAQKLAEADILVKQIKEFAEMGRAAGERDRRMLPEFANGVYMSPAFQAFRRRNGMLGGTFTGRDTLPSLLAPGEMVLNPRQMQAVRANAGFDVFKTAGIPGYANGGMAQSQPMSAGSLNVTIVVEQDAAGLWHATAQSDAGQKVIAKVVETKYANDELKMKRR